MTEFRDILKQVGPIVRSETSMESRRTGPDTKDYLDVCGVCRIPLNRFWDNEGDLAWVHSQSWKRFDHEPVHTRVPRDFNAITAACDFCCITRPLAWSLEGDEVIDRHELPDGRVFTNNMGSKWGACWDCFDLYAAGDVVGLVNRVMTTASQSRKLRGANALERRQRWLRIYTAFFNSVHTRRYIGPPVEPTPIHIKQMPRIRDGLVKWWQQPGLYDRFATADGDRSVVVPGIAAGDETAFKIRFTNSAPPPRDTFDRHIDHLVAGVRASTLYWVSSDFTQLASMASHDFAEVTLDREQLPAPFGLVVWETPVGGIQRPGGEAGIRAVSWTLVPAGIWINPYILIDDNDPLAAHCIQEVRDEVGFLLSPNVGSGLPFATHDFSGDMPGGDFMRTLLATWFLMAQPGVAEISTAPVDKKLVKVAQRTGRPLPPQVRIVNLRKRPKPAIAGNPVEGRKLEYKRFTSGHWKNQFYGPGRAQRKMIYISPYIAGADLPWRPDGPETVKVLR